MPPVGFEPTISAGERPQAYASDRAATATGIIVYYIYVLFRETHKLNLTFTWTVLQKKIEGQLSRPIR